METVLITLITLGLLMALAGPASSQTINPLLLE